MPTAALRQITAKQDNQALRARLEAEAARVQISYKASVIDFMVMEGIQDFSELDYATRKSFEAYLEGQSGMKHIRHHLLAFDKLKQHALSQEFHILEDGKVARPRYENGILYLPYHPDPKVSAMFRNSTRKNEHVWDFSRNAPERMKRQVFDILHYELENSTSPEGRRVHLLGLRDLYDFCTEQWIEDIEAMELPQIQAFREIPSNRLTESKRPGIINFCRRALFLQAEEINWNAHVWYMERFHIQPERMDPANPVLSISFVEVTHRRNRELLKRYIRYGLGITNLSVGVIRGELIYLRSFLNDIQQPEDTDICSVTPAQMEAYFRVQRQRGVQAETYNKIVMSILHFFNHLRVRQLIGQIPFDADSLLQKTVLKHHNRSVAQLVSAKYLMGLIFNGGVLLVCLGVLALRQILGDGFDLDAFLGAGLLCFVLGVAAPAFLLPLAFKFGPEKGRLLFTVLIASLCGAGFALGQTDFLSGLAIGNTVVVALAAAGVTLALYLLSWRLSIHFYQKKEF